MGDGFVIWSDSVICSYAMQGIEEAVMRRNGINVITKVIPGVTDDMLSAMNSTGIISGYMEVGRVYTGKIY